MRRAEMMIAGALALAGAGLASAPVRAETLEPAVGGFHGVEANGQFTVFVEQGEAPGVRLEGAADELEEIVVEVRRGVLRLRQRGRGILRSRRQLDVVAYVSADALRSLEFGVGTDVSVTIERASSDITIEVDTGAQANISGACMNAVVNVDTGGDLNARALECARLDIDGSTGGNADLYASQSVRAEVSTGANIDIYGNPSQRDVRASLGGDVSFR